MSFATFTNISGKTAYDDVFIFMVTNLDYSHQMFIPVYWPPHTRMLEGPVWE